MLVGAARIVLDFYNNDDVAIKRRGLTELCEDLRRKFNVSAMEVADFDEPERCVIAFSAVIPENWKYSSAKSLMEKICETIDKRAFARVTVEDWDLMSFGEEGPMVED
jgi:uncharacterized protein YlxP (DUF503 family)